MENRASNTDASRTIKLTTFTVVTHSLLPLALLVLSLYAMPHFMTSFLETGRDPTTSLKIASAVTNFVGCYPHIYILILGAAIALDAVICFSLFGSKRKFIGDVWSAFVILVQAIFAGVCALAFASVFAEQG